VFVKIKICGLTDEAAVRAVAAAKADYAGFVYFPKSPRHITPTRAAELKSLLPSSIHAVSVLVDPDDALLADIMSALKPYALQLHGKESPERVAAIKKRYPGIKIIKAIPVQTGDDITRAHSYEAADMLLFDSSPPPVGGRLGGGHDTKGLANNAPLLTSPLRGEEYLPGGTGRSFDWILLKNRDFGKPWFLSGGLNAENVQEAIHASGARMVDVSSGVESAPGKKAATRIEAFIHAARKPI
jgi:phosphoribosylanthranilate isomerase